MTAPRSQVARRVDSLAGQIRNAAAWIRDNGDAEMQPLAEHMEWTGRELELQAAKVQEMGEAETNGR